MVAFGAHIGLQDTTPADVVDLARRAEQTGFDWVSVWDHFLSSSPARAGSLESVTMHAAVAAATSRVRCGCLVYSATYRNPGVLAKAAATIDQLSGGRVEFGIGAGWSQREHEGFGLPFRPLGQRMDVLEEAVRCVTLLFAQEESDFAGEYFTLDAARCDPRPVQARIPVWIGGAGEKRTLRIAARYADGWNAPFLSPEQFAHKKSVLVRHCEDIGRDPAEIRCAANVGIGIGDELLEHHYRTMGDAEHRTADAVVTATGQELTDQIARWVEAGADQVNFTWRAPFGLGALESIGESMGALR